MFRTGPLFYGDKIRFTAESKYLKMPAIAEETIDIEGKDEVIVKFVDPKPE